MAKLKARIPMDLKSRRAAAKTLGTKYGMSCDVVDHAGQMSYEEWLENRKGGIGGSEIAAIRGISKWASAITVWREKMGLKDGDSDNEQKEFGRDLEGWIAGKAEERLLTLDSKVQVVNMRYILERSTDGFPGRANLDRMVNFNGTWGILEIKNVIEYCASEWAGSNIPEYYMDQCQWYMYVSGCRYSIIAAMIGGRSITIKKIDYDPERVADMLGAAKDFWVNHVLTESMPEPVSVLDVSAISEEFKAKDEYPEILHADKRPDLLYLQKQWTHKKDRAKALTDQADVYKAKMLKALLDAKAHRFEEAGEKRAAVSFVKGRKTLNKEKFEADFPSSFEDYEECMEQGKDSIRLLG